MRLLFVEDDPRIAEPTAAALREAGYAVTWAGTGPEGLEAAMLGDFPLIVLDVMLPGQDGFSVARELRSAGVASPILFLTARGEVDDRVQGLDLGGDAYLVKPFAMPELLAQLRALSRRDAGQRTPSVPFGAGRGVLDTVARTVVWDGQEVAVTGREYDLLSVLALTPERWYTRDELLDRVWGPEFGGEARIVDVYVRYLRRKLAPEAVTSERGRGYRTER
ncbi:DNA-binding response regulator, OmpR family, contains REC and winged-helix (wHTH) domain [Deinococcus reticulitermitis]|uniref:DNA-binding response regulator, OmpR family, contains REC and winged-helix (WHTH) domain n=1 Tax=Deinococcus reticulitermitis TaxID=856736 RepID=A0A1H6UQU8_9DEIO|nr:response regulator transcription factor [Deinococcus reticulitermitis]SEI94066.1 DNA-binding response regulator, OmpR family, contains REC and winged-helix (wHTH) domain [Deinococcus reticulitermitis]